LKRVRTFKNVFKNNNEKLELLSSFQKLIFNQQSAAPQKVPPFAPKLPPIATPLPTGKLSPYKICLETGHLIENFVNVGYLTTNMLEL